MVSDNRNVLMIINEKDFLFIMFIVNDIYWIDQLYWILFDIYQIMKMDSIYSILLCVVFGSCLNREQQQQQIRFGVDFEGLMIFLILESELIG